MFVVDIGNHNVATNGRLLPDPLDLTVLPQELVCYYEPDRSLGARGRNAAKRFPDRKSAHSRRAHDEVRDTGGPEGERRSGTGGRWGCRGGLCLRDVPGLAAMNGPSVSAGKSTVRKLRGIRKESGDLAYQERRFDDALLAYHAFAASHAGVAEPHCLLGDTFAALQRYEEAVAAYNEAEKHIEVPVAAGAGAQVSPDRAGTLMLRAIYYNRGNVRAALGDHPEAVADFGKALELDTAMGVESAAVRYNRANSRI